MSDIPKAKVLRGAPVKKPLDANAYDTFLSLLTEEHETPTTELGVFVANSTKRTIRKQFEELFNRV